MRNESVRIDPVMAPAAAAYNESKKRMQSQRTLPVVMARQYPYIDLSQPHTSPSGEGGLRVHQSQTQGIQQDRTPYSEQLAGVPQSFMPPQSHHSLSLERDRSGIQLGASSGQSSEHDQQPASSKGHDMQLANISRLPGSAHSSPGDIMHQQVHSQGGSPGLEHAQLQVELASLKKLLAANQEENAQRIHDIMSEISKIPKQEKPSERPSGW